jgi:hypothetical protein
MQCSVNYGAKARGAAEGALDGIGDTVASPIAVSVKDVHTVILYICAPLTYGTFVWFSDLVSGVTSDAV